MSVLSHFQAILDWHRQQASPVVKHLKPGLASDKLNKQAKDLPFTLPAEVKGLYGLHNGIKDNTPLFLSFTFLSLNDAIAEYELACELAEEFGIPEESDAEPEDYWKESWFPLFGYQGDFYLIDCAKGIHSPIYLRVGTEPAHLWYDTLERMLFTIRTCFDKGAYFYDDDQILTEDWEKANQIREQINTKAVKLQIEGQEPARQEIEEQPDGTKRLTTYFDEAGEHYSEQFYGVDQRKIGQAEYYQGELLRRDSYEYIGADQVEITSESLMGMTMTTKTLGRILPDGKVEELSVKTFIQGELVFEQDLTADEDEDDEDWDEDE